MSNGDIIFLLSLQNDPIEFQNTSSALFISRSPVIRAGSQGSSWPISFAAAAYDKPEKKRTSRWTLLRLLTRACRATLHLQMHRHCLHNRSPAALVPPPPAKREGKMWPDGWRCKREMIGDKAHPESLPTTLGIWGWVCRVRER